MNLVKFKSGDLVIPCYDAVIPYYAIRPYVVTPDPLIARTIMKGTWRRDDGPGLVIERPETEIDSALIVIPKQGAMWIMHHNLIMILHVETNITISAKPHHNVVDLIL